MSTVTIWLLHIQELTIWVKRYIIILIKGSALDKHIKPIIMGSSKKNLFPVSPRVIYKINPLVEVICQIKFPPILRIGSGDVSDYQDRIRTEYPLYQYEEPTIEFQTVPKELATFVEQMVSKKTGPRIHKFLTRDSKRFISLSQDFLALSESDYRRWEDFKKEIVKAEATLQEVYEPTFYYRLGLRYIDLISPESLGLCDIKWSDLLQPHILAELGVQEVADEISEIKTRCKIELPEIPGGYITLHHGLVRPTEDSELCYLFDADFSVENKEGVNEQYEDVLQRFNKLAGRLFRWAITKKLHDSMGPKLI